MRLWVDDGSTVLVREWRDDATGSVMEVALRQDPADIWGAPIRVRPQDAALAASANRGVINDGWWEMLP